MRLFLLTALLLAGCASPPLYTGFRGIASVPGACEMRQSPADLCANYKATASLRADHHVVRAREFCEQFYATALRAADLLCAYIKDQEGIMDDGEGRSSANVSARAKQLHYRYEERARRLTRGLEHALRNEGAGGTLKALEELEGEARDHLKLELNCSLESSPGTAPGLLALGLVVRSRADQKKTFEGLHALLQKFTGELMLAEERQMTALHGMLGSSLAGMEKQEVPKLIEGHSTGAAALMELGRREYPEGRALDLYLAQATPRSELTSPQVAAAFRASKEGQRYCKP